jgi:hypothetical protein
LTEDEANELESPLAADTAPHKSGKPDPELLAEDYLPILRQLEELPDDERLSKPWSLPDPSGYPWRCMRGNPKIKEAQT